MATKTWYIRIVKFVKSTDDWELNVRLHDTYYDRTDLLLDGRCRVYRIFVTSAPCDEDIYERELHLSKAGDHLILKEGARFMSIRGDLPAAFLKFLGLHAPPK